MWRAVPVAVLLLAGCGNGPPSGGVLPMGTPAPRVVTLYRDTVTVQMSDRTLCTAPRTARSGPWQTTLIGCPHTWPVAVLRPTARPRLPLVPGAGDPWVTITPPGDGALGFGPADVDGA